MFSTEKYELVKALHEQATGEFYSPDPANDGYDCWDNNVGECPTYFYGICDANNGQLPCFGCPKFYITYPEYPCFYNDMIECDGCLDCQQ